MADPYNFDTDPDPGCEKIRFGANFDTNPDPDPGKKIRIPIQQKRIKYQEILQNVIKMILKNSLYSMFCVCTYTTNIHFSINNRLN